MGGEIWMYSSYAKLIYKNTIRYIGIAIAIVLIIPTYLITVNEYITIIKNPVSR